MKRRSIRTWEELEALPEGKWAEIEEGVEIKWVDPAGAGRRARVIIPIDRRLAKSLTPGKGEVLEAQVKGDQLVLVRRRAHRRPARSRSA